jgi:hypothetical protein
MRILVLRGTNLAFLMVETGRVGTFFVPTRLAKVVPAWAQRRAHPTWLTAAFADLANASLDGEAA